MLPSYLFLRVTHLERSLCRFTCNTLIEAAILNPGHSYIPTYYSGTHEESRKLSFSHLVPYHRISNIGATLI